MKVFLTFDYELFLGENFDSPDNILFCKTTKICEVLRKHNVSATFFVDVFSSIQHKKYGLLDYSTKFDEQLIWLVQNGFDVQLHIHPHWIMSKYTDGHWVHKKEYYRLSSFADGVVDDFGETYDIEKVIAEGKNYLEKLLKEINKDYVCCAFRAGGFCIQPLDLIAPKLIKNGIFIDSSIATGAIDWNYWHSYNFLKYPKYKDYFFQNDGSISIEKRYGLIHEIPIIGMKNSVFNILFKRGHKMSPMEKNGLPINLKDYRDLPKFRQLIRRILIYNKTFKIVSFDWMTYDKILLSLKKMKGSCSIIGHPKFFNEDRLKNLDYFLYGANESNDIKIVTMREEMMDEYD